MACNGSRKGTVVKSQEYHNRQSRYTDAYRFEFRTSGSVFLIYVDACPKNPNGNNVAESHIYTCCNMICVTKGKEPQSMEIAEAIAHYWMLGYSEYIRTGTFKDQGGRVSVSDH